MLVPSLEFECCGTCRPKLLCRRMQVVWWSLRLLVLVPLAMNLISTSHSNAMLGRYITKLHPPHYQLLFTQSILCTTCLPYLCYFRLLPIISVCVRTRYKYHTSRDWPRTDYLCLRCVVQLLLQFFLMW